MWVGEFTIFFLKHICDLVCKHLIYYSHCSCLTSPIPSNACVGNLKQGCQLVYTFSLHYSISSKSSNTIFILWTRKSINSCRILQPQLCSCRSCLRCRNSLWRFLNFRYWLLQSFKKRGKLLRKENVVA